MLRIQKAIAVDNWETKEIDLITLLNLAGGNTLVFDYNNGSIRSCGIFSLEELMEFGTEYRNVSVSERR